MADTVKQIKRGYKRNYSTIQAMIAEYQKATGKTVLLQSVGIKTDAHLPAKSSASGPVNQA